MPAPAAPATPAAGDRFTDPVAFVLGDHPPPPVPPDDEDDQDPEK